MRCSTPSTMSRASLVRELGSVVDNPIVFPETGEVVSGGNFHGQPLAFVLDFMAIGVTELGSISERRTDRILDPQHSAGLPAFLAARPGVNSGYMIAQYTAAALVAENRVLAHPASVESIPTSGSQEDHVSMGWGAGTKALPGPRQHGPGARHRADMRRPGPRISTPPPAGSRWRAAFGEESGSLSRL